MNKQISDYIFSKDFKRYGHKILFKNETSGTYFLNSDTLQITELHDNGINFTLPNGQLQKGHILTMYFYQIDKNLNTKPQILSQTFKDAEMVIVGKVENLSSDLNLNQASVSLIFQQFNVVQWKNIISCFEKKQEKINQLISKQFDRGDNNE